MACVCPQSIEVYSPLANPSNLIDLGCDTLVLCVFVHILTNCGFSLTPIPLKNVFQPLKSSLPMRSAIQEVAMVTLSLAKHQCPFAGNFPIFHSTEVPLTTFKSNFPGPTWLTFPPLALVVEASACVFLRTQRCTALDFRGRNLAWVSNELPKCRELTLL